MMLGLSLSLTNAALLAGGGGGVDLTNVFGVTSTNRAKIKTAFDRVRNGTGRARVLCMGDSTTFGLGSSAGFGGNFPYYLRQAFIADSLPSRFMSMLGMGVPLANYPTYDSRFNFYTSTFGPFAPTVVGATSNVMGGTYLDLASGANGVDMTVSGAFTNIAVAFQTYPGFCSGGIVSVDGVDLPNVLNANVGSDLGLAVVQNTVSGLGSGSHVIKVRRPSGGNLRVSASLPWDTSSSYVDVLQDGIPSSRLAFHNDSAYPSSPRNGTMFNLFHSSTGAVPVDIVMINLTINDSNDGLSATTWGTNLQSLIGSFTSRGVQPIILIGPPSDTANATNGTLDAYVAKAKEVATATDAIVFDLKARWVSYAASVAKYADNTPGHPNSVPGYADWAGWVGGVTTGLSKAA